MLSSASCRGELHLGIYEAAGNLDAAGMSAQDFGDHLVRLYYGPGMPAVKTGELRQMLTPGATMGSYPSPPPPNAPPTQSSGFSARG